MTLLQRSGVNPEGKHAVVLGRSDDVGKPQAVLLMHANATVTICHSKTRNLAEVVRQADIIVAAIGRTALVTGDMVKPGAVVMDVGTNKVSDRAMVERLFGSDPARWKDFEKRGYVWAGDVDERSVKEVASLLTPVPGRRRAHDHRHSHEEHPDCSSKTPGSLMLKVGLTGGIASGKSTVGRMFGELGCRVIDSDLITRQLFEAGNPVNAAVAEAFGRKVVASDGSIDRRVLGEIVFKNPELRQKLNSLVHPAINQRQADFLAQVAAENPHAIGIVEAALMIEVGTYKNYDKMIVVNCSPEVQRRRLRERSGLTPEQIESRIASQMPMEEKMKFADFVIDNSGDYRQRRGSRSKRSTVELRASGMRFAP